MRKNFNFKKELYRGTIKQIMKVRGLRTINLGRYFEWKDEDAKSLSAVATLKFNLQDGYINMFDSHNHKIADEVADVLYSDAYDVINRIFTEEMTIPYKQRRNILVSINR